MSGKSLQDVADVFGVSRERIRQVTRHLPKPKVISKMLGRHRKMSLKALAQVKRILSYALDSTKTSAGIAKELGISNGTVNDILMGKKRLYLFPDMPRRPKNFLTRTPEYADFISEVETLLRKGLSGPEIARQLDAPLHRINYLIQAPPLKYCPLCLHPKPGHDPECAVTVWRGTGRKRGGVRRTPFRLLSVLKALSEGPLTAKVLTKLLGVSNNIINNLCRYANRGFVQHGPGHTPFWSLTEKGIAWLKEHTT